MRTPGSPTTSTATRRGSASSPTTRTTWASRYASSPSPTRHRPAAAAAPRHRRSFAIALESTDVTARTAAAELTAHLLCTPDAAALSGAEMVADAAWIGLRSHPTAAGTVIYGGPAIPDWTDGALRRVVTD